MESNSFLLHACCVQARSKSPAVHNPQPYPRPLYSSFPPSVTHEPKANTDITLTQNESGPESDYKNVWDPWDEYEQKTDTDLSSTEQVDQPGNSSQLIAESITNTASGSFESHNTNAHSVVDVTTFERPKVQPIIPDLPPPPPPAASTCYHHHTPTNSSSTEASAESKHAQKLDTTYIPVENQYSHIEHSPVAAPVVHHVPPPAIHHVSIPAIHAQPREFEPPCTVANESTLHPIDTRTHDSDGDVST